MKIAYICADFGIPVYGAKGASIHVRELCHALHRLGHEVVIVSPRCDGERPAGFDVPVLEIGLDGNDKHLYGLLRDDPDAGESVAKATRSILYANTLRRRALEILRDFEPDLIYERYSLWGSAGVALAHALQVPLMMEVNAPLSQEQANHRGLAFGATARRLERTVLRAADQVIAVSREVERWLIEVGVDAERVAVLPNGVDVTRFTTAGMARDEARARLGLTGKAVIGFVGTLKSWHGTETLLHAVACLHRRGQAPHLLVVGEGPERRRLGELAVREGIAASTTFVGAVPHERIPGFLAAMDVAVAPYHQTKNFYFSPLKLFEYMAAGLPIVAADVGQIHDCVRHGETGWLYPPGDIERLADALGAVLSDPVRAASLGRAGQAYVQAHHTWAGNARIVLELAHSLPESVGAIG